MTNLQSKWFISTNFLFHAHETIGWLQLIDFEGAWLGLAEPDFCLGSGCFIWLHSGTQAKGSNYLV